MEISSSSTSELGTIISTASSSESDDAFSFLVEGDFGCLVGEEGTCIRDFEGPATLLNIIGSTFGVHSGLLFRFLGVPWSTGLARRFKSCKTNGLFGTWIISQVVIRPFCVMMYLPCCIPSRYCLFHDRIGSYMDLIGCFSTIRALRFDC